MRITIGKFEILVRPRLQPRAVDALDEHGLRQAFAVPRDEKWFVGALQVIDSLEHETARTARNMVANTNICINAIGAGEACDELRKRFLRLRESAVANTEL